LEIQQLKKEILQFQQDLSDLSKKEKELIKNQEEYQIQHKIKSEMIEKELQNIAEEKK